MQDSISSFQADLERGASWNVMFINMDIHDGDVSGTL